MTTTIIKWTAYVLIAACGAWANHELRKTHRVIEIGPNRWAVVNPKTMGGRE